MEENIYVYFFNNIENAMCEENQAIHVFVSMVVAL